MRSARACLLLALTFLGLPVLRAQPGPIEAGDPAAPPSAGPLPAVSIRDAVVTERSAGMQSAIFFLNLSAAVSGPVAVRYATAEGTALAGSDYLPTNGVVVFPPGRTNAFIRIIVLGDLLGEPVETFQVNLSNPTNATLAKAQAVGTILDDDPPANDAFAARAILAGDALTITAFNTQAGAEPGEPGHGGRPAAQSVWWTWTAPARGSVTISTAGSDFDTTLAVYRGETLGALQLLAGDHAGAGPSASEVTFDAAAGDICQIAVDGWDGVAGQIVLSLALSAPRTFRPAPHPRPDFWDTDGTIRALVATNGVVYVGGLFSYVAPQGRKVAALDAYTGEAEPEFPAIFGSAIHVLIADGSGGWFIGGRFTQVGDLARTNLAHVLSDRRVDPDFAPDPNEAVRALALVGETLYVGGDFTLMGGRTRGRLAALDLAHRQITAWDPDANDQVAALRVSGNTVFVGGYFTRVGGQDRNRLAALDASTGLASAWNPDADGAVLTLDLLADRLFIGGFFNLVDRQPRNGLASVDALTGQATDWNPDPQGGKVTVLRALCSSVYVGGYYTSLGGASRTRLGAVDIHSGLATAWDPGIAPYYSGTLESYVLDLALAADTIQVAGRFDTVGGEVRHDLAAVQLDTGQVLPWNPGVDGGVSAVALGDRTVLAGFLGSPGGVERHNLAAFDEWTGRVLDWNPGTDDAVFALACVGDRVIAGGNFTTAGAQAHSRLAAIDRATGQAIADWNPGANNTVSALAASGNVLYAGGSFTTLGGLSRSRLAALDLLTGRVLAGWNPGADGTVDALRLDGNTLYVGGNFLSVAAQTRLRLAALDAATGQAMTWNPGAGNRVRSLAFDADRLYAGGDFTTLGNQPRRYAGAIDRLTASPAAWIADADAEVRALALSANVIYLGGSFLNVAGQARQGLAAMTASGDLLRWQPGRSPSNRVHALAVTEQALYAAGVHGLGFDGSPAVHTLAVFPRVGSPRIAQPPRSLETLAGQDAAFLTDAVGQQPLFYQWRFNGVDLAGATSAVFVITHVEPAQAGRYEVRVTNSLGLVTAEAGLMVLEPVSIVLQPMSQTVATGATVNLAVVATGHPAPTYQWRLNGMNIPGAVHPTLVLNGLQPQDGGRYDVVLAHRTGAVRSDVATVVVTSPRLPFTDGITNFARLTAASGVGSGDNTGATRDVGEPNHAGKIGGHSVWLRWVAPASGFATFSTRGSGFDTLLGIYTGVDSGRFTPLASDEDRGGFFTSHAAFNAIAGVEYAIAIDGYAAASGPIVLAWDLDPTVTDSPRILTPPSSQSVPLDAPVEFSVFASSPTPMTYQWFFGCQPIAGETNVMLLLPAVRPEHLGRYHVVVRNDSSRAAESADASLELGPAFEVVTQDKAEDLYWSGAGLGPAPALFEHPRAAAPLPGTTAFVSVSLGTIASQTFNNQGAGGSANEPLHCGVPGGHSKWYGLNALDAGVFEIDTVGSAIDTVLAVYTQANILAPLIEVACNNNGAPDRLRSLVRFPTAAGLQYLVAVDGVNGAQGTIRLNWKLNVAPLVTSLSPPQPVVRRGGTQPLSVRVDNTNPPPSFQWRCNGRLLAGATNATLNLTNVQATHAGQYSVTVSNFAGRITHEVAQVNVDVPLAAEGAQPVPGGGVRFVVVGNPGDRYVLQTSTNLHDWVARATNQLTGYEWVIVETNAPQDVFRAYRAIPAAP